MAQITAVFIRAQNYLDAFAAIGYSYGRLKDYDNAERYYRKALLRSVGSEYNKEFRPNVYQNLGNLYLQKGDSLLAKECFRRVGSADVEDFDFMNANKLEWATENWEKINKLVDEKKYEDAANAYAGFIQGLKEKMGNRSGSYITAVYCRAMLLSRVLSNDTLHSVIMNYAVLAMVFLTVFFQSSRIKKLFEARRKEGYEQVWRRLRNCPCGARC